MSVFDRKPERWEELVADEALVGISPRERAELESLVDDSVVLAELPCFELAAGEIAATAFAVQDERERLPAALETRIVARLSRGAPKAIAERPSGGSSRIPWLLAAAAILLAVAGWMREPVVRLPPPPDKSRGELLATPGTIKVDFTHTADTAATSATGDVLWHSGLQRGFMRIQGLAPNDPKVTQYQLWIFDADRTDEHPVDGGVFDVAPNERGEVIVPIRAKLSVGRAKLFAVTVERPGGVVVSKRERIVLTASTS